MAIVTILAPPGSLVASCRLWSQQRLLEVKVIRHISLPEPYLKMSLAELILDPD
jgi:hypothetical protein